MLTFASLHIPSTPLYSLNHQSLHKSPLSQAISPSPKQCRVRTTKRPLLLLHSECVSAACWMMRGMSDCWLLGSTHSSPVTSLIRCSRARDTGMGRRSLREKQAGRVMLLSVVRPEKEGSLSEERENENEVDTRN